MWDWIKGIFLPRGGVGGIRIFSTLCTKIFKGVGKNGGVGK